MTGQPRLRSPSLPFGRIATHARSDGRTCGEHASTGNLVLTSSIGTAIDGANARRDVFSACEAAAIWAVTPYDLRHTALTLLAETAASSWQLADYAGTSPRMLEGVYRHRRTDQVILLTGTTPDSRPERRI